MRYAHSIWILRGVSVAFACRMFSTFSWTVQHCSWFVEPPAVGNSRWPAQTQRSRAAQIELYPLLGQQGLWNAANMAAIWFGETVNLNESFALSCSSSSISTSFSTYSFFLATNASIVSSGVVTLLSLNAFRSKINISTPKLLLFIIFHLTVQEKKISEKSHAYGLK